MENQYVIDGLRVKLSEIQAAIRATKQRIKALEGDRATVTQALRLFEVEPEGIASGFQPGTLTRTILDTLRQSPESLSAREIAEAIARQAGRPLDKRETDMLIARVRNAVPRLSDKLDGETRERVTYWRVKSNLAG
jgi:hypothetical protein